MDNSIYRILESSNSTLLEAFKEDKKKRDTKKAIDHFKKFSKNSKDKWKAFLDWKKEHPFLYDALVIGLGIAGHKAMNVAGVSRDSLTRKVYDLIMLAVI